MTRRHRNRSSNLRRGIIREFDIHAMFIAIDTRRVERGLSWPNLARVLWDQSVGLNQERRDHPISPATLTGIDRRGDCTCQHALFILRWLGWPPDAFLSPIPSETSRAALPKTDEHHRLRWDLSALYDALNERRREQRLTWRRLADELRCTEHQLTGIRTARFAIGMRLIMRIVQWLEQPAA